MTQIDLIAGQPAGVPLDPLAGTLASSDPGPDLVLKRPTPQRKRASMLGLTLVLALGPRRR